MKYTSSEALKNVLERRDKLKKARAQRRLGWFSLGLCAVLLVLTLAISSMPLPVQQTSGAGAMGSFLLEARTGGILAAVVLAFLLGVLITLLLIRGRKHNAEQPHPQASQQHENGGKQP